MAEITLVFFAVVSQWNTLISNSLNIILPCGGANVMLIAIIILDEPLVIITSVLW